MKIPRREKTRRDANTAAYRVSVVIPVYRNPATLRELYMRLVRALAELGMSELIFVNDGCDQGSDTVLRELTQADEAIVVVDLEANQGQHSAVLAGLERSRGEWTVVLDADLQDPPEAIPSLIATAAPGIDAVFAGRRGDYESRPRLVTGRIYRQLLRLIARTPADAGAYVALSRRMVERLLEMQAAATGRAPALVAMIGCSGLKSTSLPVERARRSEGRSAYTTARRARSGLQALAWAAAWRLRRRSSTKAPAIEKPAQPATQAEIERHNASQRRYFEQTPKPTMVPSGDNPYLNRQLDEVLAAAQIRPGERVLEIGCGMGRYTLLLAARGVRVEGLDISRVLLDRLAAYDADRHDIPLHHADVLNPPDELLGQFDAVIGMFALHHIHDIAGSLRSIPRLLRPAGRVAFCEPNPYNPLYYVQIATRPGMTWKGDGGIVNIRRRPLVRALAAAGLDDLYWRRFGFFPPFLTNSPLGRLERPMESFPLWRSALPFQLFGGRLP
jgi:SAM-dependent methyltransferase/CTP:molybdopterin cytidylyltransferase MocA